MLIEVVLVVGLVLLAAGLWRRGGARYGWATAALGALVVGGTLLLSARSRSETRRTAGNAARATVPTSGDSISLGVRRPPLTDRDLAHLRWIEGTWRGSGAEQPPFYERYRFADDSTLVVESFADSTLGAVTDVTRFELRGGRLTSVPGARPTGSTPVARWVATGFTADTAVTFTPLANARNSFTWRRDSPDAWTAILDWPATADKPARRRVYDMRRWK